MSYIKKIVTLVLCAICFQSIAQVTINTISATPPKCYGICDGSITFSISGATGPFSISITSSSACINPTVPVFSTSTVAINNICPCNSMFQFKFYDGSSSYIGFYTWSVPYSATAPLTVSANIIPASCSSCCNASVYCSSTGGSTFSGPSIFYLDGTYLAWAFWPATGVCPGTHTLCARDNVGCQTCTIINVGFSSGVNEVAQENESYYIQPNPASNKFIYSGPTEEGSVIIITSIAGQEIRRKKVEIKNEHPEFDVSDLSKGIYFLQYITKDSRKVNKLIVN
jgi:hypothetical protein